MSANVYFVFIGFLLTAVHALNAPLNVQGLSIDDLEDLSEEAKANRLEQFKPVFHIHVPKTGGTGWINVILHHPGICPGMPDDVFVDDVELVEGEANADDSMLFGSMMYMNSHEHCPGLAPGFTDTSHQSILHYDAVMDTTGRGSILLRQPEQRILSDYYYISENPNINVGSFPDAPTFARAAAGMAVKLLNRRTQPFAVSDYHFQAYTEPPPTEQEVTNAAHRLQRDFAFIGLTDQYNSSVCLFHAMFGGPCHDFEFEPVVRHGEYDVKNESGYYDVSILEGFTDDYDRVLWQIGTEWFNTNLRAYGVDEVTCPNSCQIS